MTTIREQINAIEKEIMRRKRDYPKHVEAGRMTKDQAAAGIRVMEHVKNSLLLMPKEVSLVAL